MGNSVCADAQATKVHETNGCWWVIHCNFTFLIHPKPLIARHQNTNDKKSMPSSCTTTTEKNPINSKVPISRLNLNDACMKCQRTLLMRRNSLASNIVINIVGKKLFQLNDNRLGHEYSHVLIADQLLLYYLSLHERMFRNEDKKLCESFAVWLCQMSAVVCTETWPRNSIRNTPHTEKRVIVQGQVIHSSNWWSDVIRFRCLVAPGARWHIDNSQTKFHRLNLVFTRSMHA